jgi:hypothetical protein
MLKHRVQPGLTSSAADRKQEIDPPACPWGAPGRHGQTGAESWTVLANPEGNEFCAVRPKKTLIR